MLELEYITVKGFKSIASIEKLELGAINVLIGPNGSGKSNFIGAFSFLNAIRLGELQDYVVRAGGADKILHFGARHTKELHIDISFQKGMNRYQIVLQPAGADELVPQSETIYFWDRSRYSRPFDNVLNRVGKEAGISRIAYKGISMYVQKHLSRWKLYHFHDTSPTSPMKKTSDVNDNLHLRSDGSNLAPFLYLLSEKHPDSFSVITRTVQQVAPFFFCFPVGAAVTEPQQDPSGVASCRHRSLLRLVVPIRRDAAVHGSGYPVSSTTRPPTVCDTGRRT